MPICKCVCECVLHACENAHDPWVCICVYVESKCLCIRLSVSICVCVCMCVGRCGRVHVCDVPGEPEDSSLKMFLI